MTRQDWLTSNSPMKMLGVDGPFVSHAHSPGDPMAISDRKLYLFACACWGPKQMWRANDKMPALAEVSYALEVSGIDPPIAATLLRDIAGDPFAPVRTAVYDNFGCPNRSVRHPGLACTCPPWLTPTVLSIARAAYDERIEQLADDQQYERFVTNIGTDNYRCLICGCIATEKLRRNHRRFCTGSHVLDPFRLSVLGDALEEASCTNEAILSHLRSAGPHVQGCWVLDLILGLE